MRFFATTLAVLLAFAASMSLIADDDVKLETGTKAPAFTAKNINGEEITMDSFKDSDVVVVVFTCNSCPVAKAYEDRLIELSKKYQAKGVSLVAINNHRDEDLEAMKKRAKDKDINYVYAYEGSGESAKDFGAKVTPHCFVLNKNREIVYQGAFDDSMENPKTHFVNDAVEATLNGKKVEVEFKRPMGCGIKFKN
jgi:peroxiredoxin